MGGCNSTISTDNMAGGWKVIKDGVTYHLDLTDALAKTAKVIVESAEKSTNLDGEWFIEEDALVINVKQQGSDQTSELAFNINTLERNDFPEARWAQK